MSNKYKERRIKPSALSRIEKSIEDNSLVTEWFVFMVFKDGLPFYCEQDGELAVSQVERMNIDAGVNRYRVQKVKVMSEL